MYYSNWIASIFSPVYVNAATIDTTSLLLIPSPDLSSFVSLIGDYGNGPDQYHENGNNNAQIGNQDYLYGNTGFAAGNSSSNIHFHLRTFTRDTECEG